MSAKIEVTCGCCGKSFEKWRCVVAKSRSGIFFCSKECQHKKGSKPRKKPERPCETCGTVFYAGRKTRFCSLQCQNRWQARDQIKALCEVCGKEFVMRPSQAKLRTGRFCSPQCNGETKQVRPIGRMHNGKPALLTLQGYVKVWEPGEPGNRSGWVLEHRMVLQKMLGRAMKREEHAHHKDGDKTNNDPSNLVVVGIREHGALHAAEKKAREQAEQEV